MPFLYLELLVLKLPNNLEFHCHLCIWETLLYPLVGSSGEGWGPVVPSFLYEQKGPWNAQCAVLVACPLPAHPSPSSHAVTVLLLDPSFPISQMSLDNYMHRVGGRLLSRARTTWVLFQSVHEQSPHWFPGPFLPSYPPPLIKSCIGWFSHNLVSWGLRYSISKQFTSVCITYKVFS